MQNNTIRNASLAALISLLTPTVIYAELNTKVPVEQEGGFSVPLNLDMPAQPLAAALRQFSIQSNLSLTVDSALIVDKKSPAIKGRMTRKEAIQRMLDGTGLQGKIEDDKIFIQRATKEDKSVQLDKVEVRAKRFYEVGPLPGLGLTKEEIPGNVQSISAKDIKEAHSLSLTDLMNRKLQSVTVNDYQGNPFQMDVQYRGFTAGPQIGTPQGLSVFFDGIRVNEPFGDVVNWDMIPLNALAGVDVFPGSNPIFGLNTLGGAFSIKTKDGFNNAGVDADILTGSFGRKQLQVEGGWNNGTIGLFGAGNFFLEDGWRKNSPSKVNQFFGKASYRGDKLDLNLSSLIVDNDLVGNGLIPSEMYARDRNDIFTAPDETKNRLQQFQLSGSYFVNDAFTITGQVYRRNSKRHQIGGDVMTGYSDLQAARRLPNAGEEHTCVLLSRNGLGIPDYVVVPVNLTAGEDIYSSNFFNQYAGGFGANPTPGVVDLEGDFSTNVNATLPDWYVAEVKRLFNSFKNLQGSLYDRNRPLQNPLPSSPTVEIEPGAAPFSAGESYFASTVGGNRVFSEATSTIPGENVVFYGGDLTYYYSKGGNNGNEDIKNYVFFLPAINRDKCQQDVGLNLDYTGPYLIPRPNTDPFFPGGPNLIDGALFAQPGYVPGTPTAIINDNNINQVVDGASIQFNWNLEHHKFMVGASIDSASADYSNAAQLGFLDVNRNAYLDPDQAHPQFTAAFVPLRNNDFSGTNTTKSIYFSETWTPVDNWHFTASARYNETKTMNKIASRYGFFNYDIGDLRNVPNDLDLCTNINGDCQTVPRNFRPQQLYDTLNPAETEKFSYFSLNPSLGATWQANENLNLFANVSQGTRTPSVIELGCAFDRTPVQTGSADTNGDGIPDKFFFAPKSIVESRQCRLPTTLSGDPFLPQIRATSYDIGIRGNLFGNMQWNLGAFQTDLKDDIYFVTYGQGTGFFDTVGKTRRRGIESGLSGKLDKWGFGINYSLIDATFQDNFLMLSEDNSSAFKSDEFGVGVIQVKKGNRMPGTALHNLNANLSYDFTDKWTVGLSAVAHSESFVRGNENNEHRKGVVRYSELMDSNGNIGLQPLPPTNNPGKVSGYATFNLQSTYRFNKEWTATVLINNIFDREYFSAGRLGRNPFSPSINGAIGPSGYNHNSNDWLSTNFIAPGAPRGVWFSLNWHFVPD